MDLVTLFSLGASNTFGCGTSVLEKPDASDVPSQDTVLDRVHQSTVLHGFLQDAFEGAAVAGVRPPKDAKKILFSPTNGHFPISGGQKNMAFLNLAAQFIGFDTICATNRASGSDLLKEYGVTKKDLTIMAMQAISTKPLKLNEYISQRVTVRRN